MCRPPQNMVTSVSPGAREKAAAQSQNLCYCAAAFSLAHRRAGGNIFSGWPDILDEYTTVADLRPLADATVLVLGE